MYIMVLLEEYVWANKLLRLFTARNVTAVPIPNYYQKWGATLKITIVLIQQILMLEVP